MRYYSVDITSLTPYLKNVKRAFVDKPVSFARKIFEDYPKVGAGLDLDFDYFEETRQMLGFEFEMIRSIVLKRPTTKLEGSEKSIPFLILYSSLLPMSVPLALSFDTFLLPLNYAGRRARRQELAMNQ